MRIWTALAILSLAAAVLAPAGCAKIDVRLGQDGVTGATPAKAGIGRDEAVRVAKCLAEQEGADPGKYDVSAVRAGGAWWVYFDEAKPSGVRGWPAHFAVRVSPDGTGAVFKGR